MSRNIAKPGSNGVSVGKENAVQSIRRAADILACISKGINSVTDIGATCDLSKSTVHRLLKALGESELVMQDPTNRQYYLGYAIIRLLSMPTTTQEYLTSRAAAEMERLSELTGETVSLGVKMGLKNVNIHVVISKSDLKVDGANLRIRPVHLGVDGKVLLSQLDDYQASNILNSLETEFKPNGENAGTDALLSRIKAIRQRGYAVGHNEFTLGVSCISAPVRNYALPVVLNLVGPEFRVKPRLQDFTAALISSADRISVMLAKGYHTQAK